MADLLKDKPIRYVHLRVRGVKVRCRKSEFHSVDLGHYPADLPQNPETMETVKATAVATLSKGFRSVESADLCVDVATVSEHAMDDGRVFSSMTWPMMDPGHIRIKLVG